MSIPSASHPIWRIAARALVVTFCLFAYYNKMDMRDVATIATLLLSDGIMNAMKGKASE